MRKVPKLESRISQLEQEISRMHFLVEEVRDTQLFCSGTLPVLMHMSVVEGLHLIATTQELKRTIEEYEKPKLQSLMDYYKMSRHS
jgi:hypothetical protein